MIGDKLLLECISNKASLGENYNIVQYTYENAICALALSEKDRTLIVTFPGTDDMSDVKQVLNICSKDISGIKIHKGFYDYYSSMNLWLVHLIHEYRSLFDTLYITGYSLGGAASQLLLLHIANEYTDKKIVLRTFASPKLFKACSKIPVWFKTADAANYVNDFDIVPNLPYFWMFFKHGINQKRLYRFQWWHIIVYPFLALIGGNPWDHLPNKYLEKM